ncbi:hypothetical protein [Pseudomonas baetica]|uniref:hypothetical protein n=1 Tax=Pseudomonas baetica TaxID=674054 RepID=UPI0024063552|nr:hypothetical protein [Pseudomonas baetica]MDF9779314.1 hypothetical protein [Pseudomonas baetica]
MKDHDDRSLFASAARGFDYPCLPSDFFSDRAELAWQSIIGSKNRIGQLADKLRKLQIETPIPRREWKAYPDASLLSLCYGLPNFSQQLSKLVSPQQYDAMSLRALTRYFIVDLLGTRAIELREILTLGDHQRIKVRICELLPQAQSIFEQGWGSSVYPTVLTLAYLFEIAKFTEPGTGSYYQACFALNSTLVELLHTPIMELTQEEAAKHPGFREVYQGLIPLKISIDEQKQADVPNPLPLALSMSAALKELSIDVLTTNTCSVLNTHELLFTLYAPGQQGLRKAAEEVIEFQIRPRLYWVTSKIIEALRIAGISDQLGIPDYSADWSLLPSGSLSTAHFRALQPLARIEQDLLTETWVDQVESIHGKAVAASRVRQELGGLVSQASVDAALIAEAAGRLNELTANVITWTKNLTLEINGVIDICATVAVDWNSRVAEFDSPIATTAHLSDGASAEDKEMLEMALEEAQGLRTRLQVALQEVHQLGLKAEALEHQRANAYTGPVLDPGLARKLVLSPASLTPVDVLAYIQHIGGESVCILPSAWRSAEESSHFELSGRMLELLAKLVFEYAPSLAEGRPDAEAREILGTNYSAKESETVETNPDLRSERMFRVDGENRYFCRHLLVGNDPGRVRGMRIYFDILDGVVTIAYAGKHLRIASTN